jgi:hypothetical protein
MQRLDAYLASAILQKLTFLILIAILSLDTAIVNQVLEVQDAMNVCQATISSVRQAVNVSLMNLISVWVKVNH